MAAGIGLVEILGAAQALHPETFNLMIALKALTYFQDGDLPELPVEVKRLLWDAAEQSGRHPVSKAGLESSLSACRLTRRSPTRHNLHNLQAVSCLEPAFGKLRRRDGLTVVFHHHAARQQTLRHEKLFDRTRQRGRDGQAVGDDADAIHSNQG